MFFLFREVFCLGLQGVAGAKLQPGAGGLINTAADSPTNSSDEPNQKECRPPPILGLARDPELRQPARSRPVSGNQGPH